MRLVDTIQKTAAIIIEIVETRLLGEHADGEGAEAIADSVSAFVVA
jgi:hypothetical protein